ncbi:MAG TPA: TIGR03560 family F420-dependent LLM class oxidoreductase [Actinomycetota bacterium]
MDVSIMIEGQMGLTWDRWRRIALLVEQLGFAGLFRSDHFVNPGAPDDHSLEMITSLVWLADHTERIRFGPLVAPFSFRDPVMLARQAAAIDELSDGRLVLGLGAGWMEREHDAFGYHLGDLDTRFARLAEGLEVVSRLLGAREPVSFEGSHYRLRDAMITPHRRPPMCVGGGGPRRTLPLAARYADEWNAVYLPPETYRARAARLDELLVEQGREPSAVRKTMMTGVAPGASDADARAARGQIAGSSAQMREQLAALEAAGCSEVMLQWLALDDLDGLRALADALL